MAKTLNFEITTPERTVYRAEIAQVTIPTSTGEITVLPNHAPLVSILVSGVLHLKTATGEEEVLAVSGGFVEVQGNRVIILADAAERASEIDEAEAESARERARQAMADRLNEKEFASAAAGLERELARLRAVRRWKRQRPTGRDHTPRPEVG